MAVTVTFPTAVDAAQNLTLAHDIHPDQVNTADQRAIAVQAKVGKDNDPNPATLDYRVRALEGGAGSVDLSNDDPAPLAASPDAGTSPDAARADHVHERPTPSDLGAVPTSRTLAGLDLTANRSAADLRGALATATGQSLMTAADAPAVMAAVNAARVHLPSAPLLDWRLEEAVGAATLANAGSAGAAGDLTALSSGTLPAVGWSSTLGRAVRFSGTANARLAGAEGLYPAGPGLTVLAWYRPHANPTTGGGRGYIVGQSRLGGFDFGCILRHVALTQGWDATVQIGGVYTSVTMAESGPGCLALHEWQLVAFTHDELVLRAYRNEDEVGSAAAVGPIDWAAVAADNAWVIGDVPPGVGFSEPILGAVRRVQVYPAALSAADIRRIYRQGAGIWTGT